jgi:hypothetical protein
MHRSPPAHTALCTEQFRNQPTHFVRYNAWMKEERDDTSREGGLPTLPVLYLSTFQPQSTYLTVRGQSYFSRLPKY